MVAATSTVWYAFIYRAARKKKKHVAFNFSSVIECVRNCVCVCVPSISNRQQRSRNCLGVKCHCIVNQMNRHDWSLWLQWDQKKYNNNLWSIIWCGKHGGYWTIERIEKNPQQCISMSISVNMECFFFGCHCSFNTVRMFCPVVASNASNFYVLSIVNHLSTLMALINSNEKNHFFLHCYINWMNK